jgi:hypothetical protein
MALGLLRRMFLWNPGSSPLGWPTLLFALLVAAALAHLCPNTFELSHRWSGAASLAIALLFAVSLAIIYGGQQSPFLYFQF